MMRGRYRRKVSGIFEQEAMRLRMAMGASSGGVPAPDNAQYLTLAADGDLTSERVFTPGTGVAGVDSGAGAAYTLSLSFLGLEALADPGADRVMFWDDSETALKWLAMGNGPGITGTTLAVDHDACDNFVGNEHIDHTAVTLTAGAGLTGGGDISANRTFDVGAGTGIAVNANDVALSFLGLEALADPGADRVMFWDDSETALKWLAMGNGPGITGTTLAVDHDACDNFVGNEHINHTAVTLTAGAGLTGGGDISANRTFDVGAGNGITVNANDVALTTPGTLTAATGNAAAGNHTHAITTTADGETTPSTILAADANGRLRLAALGLSTAALAVTRLTIDAPVDISGVAVVTDNLGAIVAFSDSGIGGAFSSATGIGLVVDLTGAGTIADFQDNGTPVLTIQDGGESDFTEYIRHLGDTNTYLRFETDRVRCYAGGVEMWDAYETGTDYLNLHAGLVGINETANANMAIGLTIDQAANDDESLNIRSSDVGAVLSAYETNTYMAVKKSQGSSGGALIAGLKDADGGNYQALGLAGYLAENANTNKTTAARAIIEMYGYQTDGADIVNTVANGNLLALRTYRGAAFVTVGFWDEDGDFYYDGALNNYDDYNDSLAAWDLSHGLAGEWNKIIEYGADKLEAMGVIGPADENGERMVSNKRMNALQLGAIGQGYFDRLDLRAEVERLSERCQRYELALSNAGLLEA